ncbi:hypothetical protein Q7P37_011127 [Cladosporium fusiforme]
MVRPEPTQSKIHGCHLLGSISGCPDAYTAFTTCAKRLPNRLKRFPDGEPGERQLFTFPQMLNFMNAGILNIIRPFEMNKAAPLKDFTPAEIEQGNAALSQLTLETGYDKAAIESYAVFAKLKQEGLIPPQAKFQVCLPTSANVAIIVYQQFRATAFAVHEAALFRAMRRIQDAIPHEELSIQIDLSIDTALWEGMWESVWYEEPKETQLGWILRMIEQVDTGVELGLHNCYGDMQHKHFYEPTSLQPITDRALALLSLTPHKIAYFHCPVPQSAMPSLPNFLSPLETLYPALQEHGCELYLGLVIFNDAEGTRKRIEEALRFAPEFGVATACGWGRTPEGEIEEGVRLLREVSGRVW